MTHAPVQAAPQTVQRDTGPPRWLMLPVLVAAQFIVILDASIVNIAIPAIETDLGFAAADLQWIINAYVLAFGGLLLLGGRLTDLIDGRTVFLAGLALFGAASAACALADRPGLLLAARAGQGVGAAMLSPSGLSLLTSNFTGGRRATALGWWGAISGLAGAVGVLLGGVLTDGPGWSWIFWVNVPVCLLVAVGALLLVPRASTHTSGSHDFVGSCLVSTTIIALVFGVVRTAPDGWTSPVVLGSFTLSALLLVAFVLVERRVHDPLVPLTVFRLRDLTVGNTFNIAFGAVQLTTFFLLTLYLQQVRGDSALTSGLAYLPLAAAAFVGSGLCSSLLPKIGPRIPLTAGMTLLGAGLAWFSFLGSDGSYASSFLAPSLVLGVGLGLAAVAVLAAATQDLGGEGESGLASGLVNTTQQVGGAVGLAVLSTIAFDRSNSLATGGTPFPAALLDGLSLALRVGAGVALAGALLAALALSRQAQPARADQPALAQAVPPGIEDRLRRLQEHRDVVVERMLHTQDELAAVDSKIADYRELTAIWQQPSVLQR